MIYFLKIIVLYNKTCSKAREKNVVECSSFLINMRKICHPLSSTGSLNMFIRKQIYICKTKNHKFTNTAKNFIETFQLQKE